MKKLIFTIALLFLAVGNINAQQEKGIIGFTSWLNNWTEFKPNKIEHNEVTEILTGIITVDTRLFKKNVYLLQGKVYVTNNATLTIEAGTVIMGDSESKGALIITKGAAIVANGSETDPVVFTSNKPVKKAGDWGGIILLGDAPTNKFGNVSSVNFDTDQMLSGYGGDNPVGTSGTLRFVRIEYAGAKVKGGENYNALLLAGVGNKTKITKVMASFCAGDSFEFLGGEGTANNLVSFKANNDDFKFNYGAQYTIDNSLAIRSSHLTSSGGARCMNVLSYNKKEEVDFSKKHTLVRAKNLTFVNNSDKVKIDIESGLIKEGVYVGDNASIDFKKSVISGFNPAILLDSKITINTENLKKIKLEQMYFNLCKGNIFVENTTNNDDLESWYGNAAFGNVYYQGENAMTFIDYNNDKRPDFRLRIGGITGAND